MLIDIGAAKEDDVAKALAKQFRIEYVDVSQPAVSEQIDLKLIPDELIRKHLVLPMTKQGGKLRLIIHDPKDLELLDMLRFRLNTEIEPRLCARSKIKAYLDAKEGAPKPSEANQSLLTESIDRSIDKSVDRSIDSSIDQAAESAPIIKLCTRIIVEAVKGRASDIHIEPMNDRVRLRYRVDGVCIERDNLPKRSSPDRCAPNPGAEYAARSTRRGRPDRR